MIFIARSATISPPALTSEHWEGVLPIAKGRHVGDPAPLPARSRVERADQEERLALNRHAHATPPGCRVGVAGEPGHGLDFIEQRDVNFRPPQLFAEAADALVELASREMGMRP